MLSDALWDRYVLFTIFIFFLCSYGTHASSVNGTWVWQTIQNNLLLLFTLANHQCLSFAICFCYQMYYLIYCKNEAKWWQQIIWPDQCFVVCAPFQSIYLLSMKRRKNYTNQHKQQFTSYITIVPHISAKVFFSPFFEQKLLNGYIDKKKRMKRTNTHTGTNKNKLCENPFKPIILLVLLQSGCSVLATNIKQNVFGVFQ